MPRIGVGNWVGFGGGLTLNGVPFSLTTVVLSDTSIRLACDSTSTNEDGFRWYISLDGVSYPTSETTASGVKTIDITGLTENTTYYFYVVAYKGSKLSGESNIASDITLTTLGAALIGRMVSLSEEPTEGRKKIIDNRLNQLSSAGLLSKIDCLYVFASEGELSARLNWVSESYNLTTDDAPDFQIDCGVNGNISTKLFKTGFIPSSANGHYTRDSASFGVYSLTHINELNNILGVGDSDGTGLSYLVLSTRVFTQVRINSLETAASVANTNTIGMFSASRNSSTEVCVYLGTTKYVKSQASNGISSNEYYILARNSGSIVSPSKNQIAFAWIGGSLTDEDIANLKTILVDGYLEDIKHDVADVITASKKELAISTYDGSGQTVHPSVINIGSLWNGYQYWMAITPYPNGSAIYENPSIYCSSDGETWIVPDGLTNPVIPSPNGDPYNADPALFYENNVLYMIWVTSEDPTSIYLSESTDGITWSARRKIMSITDGFDDLLVSVPSLIKIGSLYYMYYTSTITPLTLTRRSSTSIYGPYTNLETTNVTGFLWNHPKVKYYNNKYYVTYNSIGIAQKDGNNIFIGTSNDGLNFIRDTFYIVNKTTPPENYFYVSCFEEINGVLKLYYSITNVSAEWLLMQATLVIT